VQLTRLVLAIGFALTAAISHSQDNPASLTPKSSELESNLPIIVINTFGVPIPDDPKITGHMGIIDNGPGQINSLDDPFNGYDGSIGIEVRGQSSQMFPKKSYAMETRDSEGQDLDASLLGLPEESDWVLYAPYSDKSMLRNATSFEMGRLTGHYCTRVIFCELVVNGDYAGVYNLMEQIKKDSNRVDISTLKEDDILGNELTGGYIIKVDKIDPDFLYGRDGWKCSPWPPYPDAKEVTFQYYYPEADELAPEQKEYIQDYVNSAANSLTAAYFANPDAGYQKYLDVRSFVDFMLLCEVSKEVDKYRYSTYFYKEKITDGGKLFAGPAWDFDLGYGNVDYWPPGVDWTGWFYPSVEPVEWSIIFWWKRMMEDPYFRNFTRTRWEYLRDDRLSNARIHAYTDSIVELIDEAKDRNFERWPILGTYVWPNYNWYGNDYTDEVENFEKFLFSRMNWMDYNVAGQILHPKAGISAEGNQVRVHLYDDYFCRKDLKDNYFTLNNLPPGVTVQGVTYLSASECILSLSDEAGDYPELTVTVSEKALNYWEDLTSNALGMQGLGDEGNQLPAFRIYNENHSLHLSFDPSEELPLTAEIISMEGKGLGSYPIAGQTEPIISHQLRPGIYIAVLRYKDLSLSARFSVTPF